jgi:hypothetical protein
MLTPDLISSLLDAPVPADDPRLATVLALEPGFDAVCKQNMLFMYADEIAEYLVDPSGACRADLSADSFAQRFATSADDAAVVVRYVKAFFQFFPPAEQC